MARRRNKEFDIIGLVGPLAGLVAMATMFYPQARQAIFGLGFITVVFLGVIAGGFIAFAIYRHFTPAEKPELSEFHPLTIARDFVPTTLPRPSSNGSTPPLRPCATTAEVLVQKRQPSSSNGPTPSPEKRLNLASQLRSIDWFQFEKVVDLAYRKSGYSVQRRGGANPDGGIDLLIRKDGETKAVQCKHWQTWEVGIKDIREFLGALTHAKLAKGIFITLKGYTPAAKQLADNHGIELISERELILLLEGTDVRFDPKLKALLTDQQKHCPKCESKMVERTTRKGANIGQKFWGCSQFPRCRFILKS